MDNDHSTSWTSSLNEDIVGEFLLEENQELLDTFFDFTSATAEPAVNDPDVMEGASGSLPGYTDHTPYMQNHPTSSEDHATEPWSLDSTQWNP